AAPVEEEMVDETTMVESDPVEVDDVDQTTGDQDVDSLLAEVVNDIYSEERLPKLKMMFQEGGLEGFPQSMGVAVVGGLSVLDVESLPDETLAEVGVQLFEMLSEDIIESGEVQGVTPEILIEAAKTSIQMFAEKYPDKFN